MPPMAPIFPSVCVLILKLCGKLTALKTNKDGPECIFSMLFQTCGYGPKRHSFTSHTLLLFPASSNGSSVLEQIHFTWSDCAILHHPSLFPPLTHHENSCSKIFRTQPGISLIKDHKVGIAIIYLHFFYLSSYLQFHL